MTRDQETAERLLRAVLMHLEPMVRELDRQLPFPPKDEHPVIAGIRAYLALPADDEPLATKVANLTEAVRQIGEHSNRIRAERDDALRRLAAARQILGEP